MAYLCFRFAFSGAAAAEDSELNEDVAAEDNELSE
jgi:hypothetical protein